MDVSQLPLHRLGMCPTSFYCMPWAVARMRLANALSYVVAITVEAWQMTIVFVLPKRADEAMYIKALVTLQSQHVEFRFPDPVLRRYFPGIRPLIVKLLDTHPGLRKLYSNHGLCLACKKDSGVTLFLNQKNKLGIRCANCSSMLMEALGDRVRVTPSHRILGELGRHMRREVTPVHIRNVVLKTFAVLLDQRGFNVTPAIAYFVSRFDPNCGAGACISIAVSGSNTLHVATFIATGTYADVQEMHTLSTRSIRDLLHMKQTLREVCGDHWVNLAQMLVCTDYQGAALDICDLENIGLLCRIST